jgi:hypothetical protein
MPTGRKPPTPGNARIANRRLIFAVALSGIFIVALLATVSLGTGSKSSTVAEHAAAHAATAVSAVGSASTMRDTLERSANERDFDYFPDRYVNQATEPVGPVATF